MNTQTLSQHNSCPNSFNLKQFEAGFLKRAVILQKTSLLEEMRRGQLSERLTKHIVNDSRALLADKEHSLTIDVVHSSLAKHNIDFRAVERLEERDISWADILLCVGGDGTFLRASKHVNEYYDKPILGINSSPSSSFGFFSACDYTNFSDMLDRLLSGDVPLRGLWRMRAFINERPVGNLVLNEALFSSPLPSGTTRYVLRNGGIEQSQVSSGVWISTASGSTGAIHAAGGEIQSLDDRRLQYRVRELFTLSAVKAAGAYSPSGMFAAPHVYKVAHVAEESAHTPSIHEISNNLHNMNTHSQVQTTPFRPDTLLSSSQPFLQHNSCADDSHLVPEVPVASNSRIITPDSATATRTCTYGSNTFGFSLMEGGYLCPDFCMTSRMQSATIYLDGGGPDSAIEVGFGDRVTFRSTKKPLLWISPTQSSPYEHVFTDNWQTITGRSRPDNPSSVMEQHEEQCAQPSRLDNLGRENIRS